MPPKKTHEELREWYGRFAKEMYEKMQIDVTRKEDLGRIKSYQIVEWDPDEPMLPEVKPMYAYMPHAGTEYTVPEPAIPDPNDDPTYDGVHIKTDYYRNHAKWMTDNLNPDLTDEQLQDLYDHSCNGTLIATQPGKSYNHIQQIRTDADGNIKISVTADMYLDQSTVPEDQRAPEAPEVVAEPNPADFGRPEMPVPPKNMKPNWLSRLGHYLGIHTDYTDLLDYQKAVETYPDRMTAWKQDPNGLEAFEQAAAARAAYLEHFTELQNHPYYKFCALDSGVRNRIQSREDNEQIVVHFEAERSYLEGRHKVTLMGKAAEELQKIDQQLSYAVNTELAIHNIVGHDPHPEQMTYWLQTKVFNPETFKPEKYDLPPVPNSDGATGDQLEMLEAEWKDLADVAGFAAISDCNIAGDPLRPGFNLEESANLNYTMLMANLFTEGRPNSWRELPYGEPARALAKTAMEAYSDNMPQQLGGLFARSLRQTVREAAGLHNMARNDTMGTLHLVSRLVEKLDKHPLLLAASGLKPEELEEARGYAELYNVLTDGIKARKALLEHVLGKNPLSPEELAQAGKDALFANVVIREVAIANKEQNAALENSEDHKQFEQLMVDNAAYDSMYDRAAEAEKQGWTNAAQGLKELGDQMKHLQMVNRSKLLLLEHTRPGYHSINKNLLNKDWVNAVKDQLAEKAGLAQILSGSRNSIIETFLNNSELANITKDLALEPKSNQPEKALDLQEPVIEAPQNSAPTI